jgi:Fe-S-cluster containining protein
MGGVSEDDDAPVTRRELERALRFVNAAIADGRDDLLRLAAQVVALGEASGGEVAAAAERATPDEIDRVLAADERSLGRVELGAVVDKYEVEAVDPGCAERMPICQARCCRLELALSTQDLDEGVIRWDYGRPYLIRHRASDRYCVHNDPATHACTAHAHRPALCRTYTCKDDPRIWADYDARVLAGPVDDLPLTGDPPGETFDLQARAKRRQLALAMESTSVRNTR